MRLKYKIISFYSPPKTTVETPQNTTTANSTIDTKWINTKATLEIWIIVAIGGGSALLCFVFAFFIARLAYKPKG